jgi:hypothetical protein
MLTPPYMLLSRNSGQIKYLLGEENNFMFWFYPYPVVLDNIFSLPFPSGMIE